MIELNEEYASFWSGLLRNDMVHDVTVGIKVFWSFFLLSSSSRLLFPLPTLPAQALILSPSLLLVSPNLETILPYSFPGLRVTVAPPPPGMSVTEPPGAVVIMGGRVVLPLQPVVMVMVSVGMTQPVGHVEQGLVMVRVPVLGQQSVLAMREISSILGLWDGIKG
jgi:hypothetical protein